MRLARIELHGPAGQVAKLEANGEGELQTEIHATGFVFIRDTGLPPYDMPKVPRDPKAPPPNLARIVAQIPLAWAVFPEWEITEPPKVARADTFGAADPIRHTGAVIPNDDCLCDECNEARMRRAGNRPI